MSAELGPLRTWLKRPFDTDDPKSMWRSHWPVVWALSGSNVDRRRPEWDSRNANDKAHSNPVRIVLQYEDIERVMSREIQRDRVRGRASGQQEIRLVLAFTREIPLLPGNQKDAPRTRSPKIGSGRRRTSLIPLEMEQKSRAVLVVFTALDRLEFNTAPECSTSQSDTHRNTNLALPSIPTSGRITKRHAPSASNSRSEARRDRPHPEEAYDRSVVPKRFDRL